MYPFERRGYLSWTFKISVKSVFQATDISQRIEARSMICFYYLCLINHMASRAWHIGDSQCTYILFHRLEIIINWEQLFHAFTSKKYKWMQIEILVAISEIELLYVVLYSHLFRSILLLSFLQSIVLDTYLVHSLNIFSCFLFIVVYILACEWRLHLDCRL